MTDLDDLLEITRARKATNETVRDAFKRGEMTFFKNSVKENTLDTSARYDALSLQDQRIIELLERLIREQGR